MLQRPKPFKLDAGNQAKIEALFKASPSNCAVVTQRINADPVGYGLPADTTVSRRSVERYGKTRFPRLFAKSAMLPVQPFHCEKGEQLQIDFVQAKFRYGGSGSTDAPSTVYIFGACYAWSRKSFVWVCPDMTQASWLLGIAKCLAVLGIPRTILCDNDKDLVIRNGSTSAFSTTPPLTGSAGLWAFAQRLHGRPGHKPREELSVSAAICRKTV